MVRVERGRMEGRLGSMYRFEGKRERRSLEGPNGRG